MFSNKSLCFPHSKEVHLPLHAVVCSESKFSLANVCCSSPVTLRALPVWPQTRLSASISSLLNVNNNIAANCLPGYCWGESGRNEIKFCKIRNIDVSSPRRKKCQTGEFPHGYCILLTNSIVACAEPVSLPKLFGRRTGIKHLGKKIRT